MLEKNGCRWFIKILKCMELEFFQKEKISSRTRLTTGKRKHRKSKNGRHEQWGTVHFFLFSPGKDVVRSVE